MAHQMTIHNLGPIRDCTLELRDFTVLSGPQSNGKSTIAKAVYFFRTVKQDILQIMMQGGPKNATGLSNATWNMTLKDSQESVGNICFKGPVKNHAVEIGYGVQPEQERNGYTTEALQAMTQWAFSQKNVVFTEAETAPDNKASQRVLEKCGFVPDGMGEEGPRFMLERPLTNWSTIYMLFGMSIGMAIGHFQDQMLWGMAIGISLGVLVGTLLNHSAKKNREALRQQRHPHA